MSVISLNSRFDHLHNVAKTGRAVDDFHAGIALKYGHDAAATIMSIESNFWFRILMGRSPCCSVIFISSPGRLLPRSQPNG
jgi:hypothetical protein